MDFVGGGGSRSVLPNGVDEALEDRRRRKSAVYAQLKEDDHDDIPDIQAECGGFVLARAKKPFADVTIKALRKVLINLPEELCVLQGTSPSPVDVSDHDRYLSETGHGVVPHGPGPVWCRHILVPQALS